MSLTEQLTQLVAAPLGKAKDLPELLRASNVHELQSAPVDAGLARALIRATCVHHPRAAHGAGRQVVGAWVKQGGQDSALAIAAGLDEVVKEFSNPACMYAASRLALAALHALAAPDCDAAKKLTQVLSLALEALASHSGRSHARRMLFKTTRLLGKLFSCAPALVGLTVLATISSDGKTCTLPGCLSAVLSLPVAREELQKDKAILGKLLEVINKSLLASKEAPSTAVIQALCAVASTLQPDDLQQEPTKLLGAMDRVLKLSAERKLAIVSQLVSALTPQVGLLPMLQETLICTSAFKNLSSSKAAVQDDASALVVALAGRATEASEFVQIVQSLVDVLQGNGAGGKAAVVQTSQRLCLVSTLASLAFVVREAKQGEQSGGVAGNQQAATEASSIVVEALASLLSTESNDEVRAKASAAASNWILGAPVNNQAALVELLVAQLGKGLQHAKTSTGSKTNADVTGTLACLMALTSPINIGGSTEPLDAVAVRRSVVAKWLVETPAKPVDVFSACCHLAEALTTVPISAKAALPSEELVSQTLSALAVLLACEGDLQDKGPLPETLTTFLQVPSSELARCVEAMVAFVGSASQVPSDQRTMTQFAAVSAAHVALARMADSAAQAQSPACDLLVLGMVSRTLPVQRGASACYRQLVQTSKNVQVGVSRALLNAVVVVGDAAFTAAKEALANGSSELSTIDVVFRGQQYPSSSALRKVACAVAQGPAWSFERGSSGDGAKAARTAAALEVCPSRALLPLVLVAHHPYVTGLDKRIETLVGEGVLYATALETKPSTFRDQSAKAWHNVHRSLDKCFGVRDGATSRHHTRVEAVRALIADPESVQGLQALLMLDCSQEGDDLTSSSSRITQDAAQCAVSWFLHSFPASDGLFTGASHATGSDVAAAWAHTFQSHATGAPWTDNELLIWATPTTQLADVVVEDKADDDTTGAKAEGQKAGAAGKSKANKGKKAQTKGTGRKTAGDEWEQQVRRELEAKKTGVSGESKSLPDIKSALGKQMLQDQTEVRSAMQARVAPVVAVLQALQCTLAAGGPSAARLDGATQESLARLGDSMLPLMSCPIVGSEARAAVACILRYDRQTLTQTSVSAADDLARAIEVCRPELIVAPKSQEEHAQAVCSAYPMLLGRVVRVLFAQVHGLRADFDPLGTDSARELSPMVLALTCSVLTTVALGSLGPDGFSGCADDSDDGADASAAAAVAAAADGDGADAEDDTEDQDEEGVVEEERNLGSLGEQVLGVLACHAASIGRGNQAATRHSLLKVLLLVLEDEDTAGCTNFTSQVSWNRPATVDVLVALCDTPGALALLHDDLSLLLGNHGLLHASPYVRVAVLTALLSYQEHTPLALAHDATLCARVWFASMDEDSAARALAEDLLADTDADFPRDFVEPTLQVLSHTRLQVREQAGRTLALGLEEHPDSASEVFDALVALFNDMSVKDMELSERIKNRSTLFFEEDIRKLERDEKGRDSLWAARSGVALALTCLVSPSLDLDASEGVTPAAAAAAAIAKGESGVVEVSTATAILEFALGSGLRDTHPLVRQHMLDAGMAVVAAYGKDQIDNFMALLNRFLEAAVDTKGQSEHDARASDWQREGAVVCLGALAAHLALDDAKVPAAVDTLVEALRTPSEAVQLAVTKCLPPLLKSPQLREKVAAKALLDRLMDRAFDPDPKVGYGPRRGAALGVAGVAKGLGVMSVKQHGVVTRLQEAGVAKAWGSRQGALMTFETLCFTLGMLFEPYVTTILPLLLQSFADVKLEVRQSAHEAAKVTMGKLSAHGVKLVLPTLLEAIQDPAWRTKQAAIQLLGSMAYCAPKQLASCLPEVVPRLVEAFTDTHTKVRLAGRAALEDVGSVIKNPEIQRLVPTLMDSLMDPHKKTSVAVNLLHRTRFVHTVDAASLSLMVPILHRGLKERSTDVKKKSALIVGNMCSMISDPRAVQPYVESLIPVLKQVLVDPIPGVRSTAAKAFGTLVKGLGEKLPDFESILQWLVDTMRCDISGVERSGGAQGLVEVLVALGNPRMDEVLYREVFSMASSPLAHVREGAVWVLSFLPPTLKRDGNAVYIHRELTVVLSRLSDSSEPVRDVSMRAGQALVKMHAISHTNDLLPALEGGLDNENWRIRLSSLNLLGDLLFRVGGAYAAGVVLANSSAAQAEDEDDAESVGSDEEEDDVDADVGALSTVEVAIIKALGSERRDRVLSMLYIMRNDNAAAVRQSALNVWKSVVANTPRTIRKVLPTLMRILIDGLSGSEEDRQVVAGRTLGDIVRKLGDRVLPEIMPTIQAGLTIKVADAEDDEEEDEDDALERAGVSLGLRQVMAYATKSQLEAHWELLLPAVLQAICDPNEDVREHGAVAYNLLQRGAGDKVMNKVVPQLLNTVSKEGLDSAEGKRSLRGLREVVAMRGREVLPFVLPRLLASPMPTSQAAALGAVAQVTGATLHYHLSKVFPVLIKELAEAPSAEELASNPEEKERIDAVRKCATAVVSAITDAGIHSAVPDLLAFLGHPEARYRRVAALLVADLCSHCEADITEQIPHIMKELIKRFTEPEEATLKALTDAMVALCARVSPAEMMEHVGFMRDVIQNVASSAKHRTGPQRKVDSKGNFVMAAFCVPGAIAPILQVLQYALTNGSSDDRRGAAEGLEELIMLTPSEALKKYVVKITGPLIRIVGDRFSADVKAAILSTLYELLDKAGPFLRPFLPQLQTTFVKALYSETPAVRQRSERALGRLIQYSTRVDALVVELANGAVSDDTADGVRLSMLRALDTVLQVCAPKVSAVAANKMGNSLPNVMGDREPKVREAGAKALLMVVALLPADSRAEALQGLVMNPVDAIATAGSPAVAHATALMFSAGLAHAPSDFDEAWVLKSLQRQVNNSSLDVAVQAVVATAVGHYVAHLLSHDAPADEAMALLTNLLGFSADEVRIAGVQACTALAHAHHEAMYCRVAVDVALAKALVECATKDKSSVVRAQGEECWYVVLGINTEDNKLKAFVGAPPGGNKEVGSAVNDLARRTLNKMNLQ